MKQNKKSVPAVVLSFLSLFTYTFDSQAAPVTVHVGTGNTANSPNLKVVPISYSGDFVTTPTNTNPSFQVKNTRVKSSVAQVEYEIQWAASGAKLGSCVVFVNTGNMWDNSNQHEGIFHSSYSVRTGETGLHTCKNQKASENGNPFYFYFTQAIPLEPIFFTLGVLAGVTIASRKAGHTARPSLNWEPIDPSKLEESFTSYKPKRNGWEDKFAPHYKKLEVKEQEDDAENKWENISSGNESYNWNWLDLKKPVDVAKIKPFVKEYFSSERTRYSEKSALESYLTNLKQFEKQFENKNPTENKIISNLFKAIKVELENTLDTKYKNNSTISSDLIKEQSDLIKQQNIEKFIKTTGGVSVGVIISLIPIAVWLISQFTDSPEFSVDVSPVTIPWADIIQEHNGTPAGSVALASNSLGLHTPQGWKLLVSEDTAGNPEELKRINPNGLAIMALLPGKPTSVKSCTDDKSQITKLVVGTTLGGKILHINRAGDLVDQSSTLFPKAYTDVIGTYQDTQSKKCAVSFVSQTQEGILKPYALKETSASFSAKTTEQDLTHVIETNMDNYENIYSADSDHPDLVVRVKDPISNKHAPAIPAGLPKGAVLSEPLISLPNKHFLASTVSHGFFYSGKKGLFSPLSKAAQGELGQFNTHKIILQPQGPLDQKENQTFKLAFFSNHTAQKETPTKGARILTIPLDKNEESLDVFESQDLFASSHVVSYDDEMSVLTIAGGLETVAHEGEGSEGKPKRRWKDISFHHLAKESLISQEVVSSAYSPESTSPFLFFALKEKGLLRVDTNTDQRKIIRNSMVYKTVAPLFQTSQLLLVSTQKLEITDSHGNDLALKNEFSFPQGEITSIDVALNKENKEDIIVGTTAGVYLLSLPKDSKTWKQSLLLFADEKITRAGVNLMGEFVIETENFPQGLKTKISLLDLKENESPELLFEAL